MDKIKEVLHAPKSNEAARGEVDHNTPGSFPTDDETTTGDVHQTPGHEHNKLHKPNDPRGWTDNARGTHGHGHTDSGVGLVDTHHSLSAETPEERVLGNTDGRDERAARSQMKEPGSNDSHTIVRSHPSDRAADHSSAAYQPLGTGASNAAVSSEGTQPVAQSIGDSKITQKDAPYWGDLPRGAGVYNTIAGHGSAEDDRQRRRETRDRGSDDKSTFDNANLVDSSQHRSFPLVTAIHGSSSNAEGGQVVQDSHAREDKLGAVSTGSAGFGAAAYGIGRRDEGSEASKGIGEINDPQSHPDEGSHKHFGIIQHGSKSDGKSSDDAKQQATAKDSTKSNHPVGAKIAGIFHRSEDNTRVPDSRTETFSGKNDENEHDTADRAKLAGAGSMGAAGVSVASSGHQAGTDTKESATDSRYQQAPAQTIDSRNNNTSSYRVPGTHDANDPAIISKQMDPPLNDDGPGKLHHNTPGAIVGATTVGAGVVGFGESEGKHVESTDSPVNPGNLNVSKAEASSSRATASGVTTSGEQRVAPETSTRLADAANQGQYAILASGTPSGIRIDKGAGLG